MQQQLKRQKAICKSARIPCRQVKRLQAVKVIATTLGNPFNLSKILAFCKRNNLWMIEDNCDALGSNYTMPKDMAYALGHSNNSPGIEMRPNQVTRWTGTWGDMSTQSFYPPHHLTMGEGGAVNISGSIKLKRPGIL